MLGHSRLIQTSLKHGGYINTYRATHAYKHIHVQACPRTHTNTCTHRHAQPRTHAHAHTDEPIQTCKSNGIARAPGPVVSSGGSHASGPGFKSQCVRSAAGTVPSTRESSKRIVP